MYHEKQPVMGGKRANDVAGGLQNGDSDYEIAHPGTPPRP